MTAPASARTPVAALRPTASQMTPPPILPVLEGPDLLRSAPSTVASVLDVGVPILVTRGAVAIELALRDAGIGPGAEVLVPAFHCPSMVAPVRASGAAPVFYGIDEDLGIEPQALEARVTARTRALLAPHFFARTQDFTGLRRLCDAHRLVLIEDCAHAFFGAPLGRPVGSQGHYAVASPRKFFALAEGGLLTSAQRDLRGLKLRRPSASRSVRLLFDSVDVAVASGRLAAIAPAIRAIKAARRSTRREPVANDGAEQLSQHIAAGRPAAEHAAWATSALLRQLMTDRATSRRREHFERTVTRLAGAAGLELLFTELPQDSVPYMVPVVLSNPRRQFTALKERGVPVWRWEYSERGICAVTDRYAEALVQVPCHQSLTAAEIDWMVATLLDVGRLGG
jgi:perosamine synthetase